MASVVLEVDRSRVGGAGGVTLETAEDRDVAASGRPTGTPLRAGSPSLTRCLGAMSRRSRPSGGLWRATAWIGRRYCFRPLATLKQASPCIVCRAGMAQGRFLFWQTRSVCIAVRLFVLRRCARTPLGVSPKRERNSRLKCEMSEKPASNAMSEIRRSLSCASVSNAKTLCSRNSFTRPVNVVPVEAMRRWR
jgi:hypothetical protein